MANITLAEAREVVAAAQKLAETVDKPLTVVVVDSAGFVVLVERMDGARPLQPQIATAKAYTAAVMQRPCSMLKGWADHEPGFFAQVSRMGHHPIVAAGGGFPLKRDGEIVGAVGISGGTGDEDEALAQGALEALGYPLDFPGFNKLAR
ncbi:MAG TPA: heme-binding protein [Gaiellaceae bacterium]|nr:heme-binding protein [Gaiellaceae bacterium]